MREIKFRVWDNLYKYMNYKVLVGMYGEWEKVKDDKNYTACCMWVEPDKVDYECEPHWAHFEPYHNDIHLMQYTGLKDKNGVEIYEGDIISIIYYNYDEASEDSWGNLIPDEIVCSRIITMEFIYTFNLMGEYDETSIEVIGNIYENKELLKKEGK